MCGVRLQRAGSDMQVRLRRDEVNISQPGCEFSWEFIVSISSLRSWFFRMKQMEHKSYAGPMLLVAMGTYGVGEGLMKIRGTIWAYGKSEMRRIRSRSEF